MSDTEKVKMILNIGGTTLSVNVNFADQDFAREVEAQVDSLYRLWRKDPDFKRKSDHELLAMVAYQFAYHYAEMTRLNAQAAEMAAACMARLDQA